jgi:hypothetical protein
MPFAVHFVGTFDDLGSESLVFYDFGTKEVPYPSSQSFSLRPSTRENSAVLCVTSVIYPDINGVKGSDICKVLRPVI